MAEGRQRALGTFKTRPEAEHAIAKLREGSFNMANVSLIAKHDMAGDKIAGTDVDEAESAGRAAVAGTQTGGVIGGVVGLLAGATALAIPGLGPVIAAGALGTVLSATVVGASAGASVGALGGALLGYGISNEEVSRYERAIEEGGYLLLIEGSDQKLRHAQSILKAAGIENYGEYSVPTDGYEDSSTRL